MEEGDDGFDTAEGAADPEESPVGGRYDGGGVAFLATSVTEARGLAEVDDLSDEAESGEMTDGREVAGAADAGLVAEGTLAVGAVAAGLAPGASEARRVGAAGVAVVEGRDVLVGGGIEVRLLPVAVVEAVLRMVVVAVGGLELAPAVAVAFVAAAEGGTLVVPAPNVPELRT